jgi:hypothetical protein
MPSDWHRSRRPATMPLPQVTARMAAAVLVILRSERNNPSSTGAGQLAGLFGWLAC